MISGWNLNNIPWSSTILVHKLFPCVSCQLVTSWDPEYGVDIATIVDNQSMEQFNLCLPYDQNHFQQPVLICFSSQHYIIASPCSCASACSWLLAPEAWCVFAATLAADGWINDSLLLMFSVCNYWYCHAFRWSAPITTPGEFTSFYSPVSLSYTLCLDQLQFPCSQWMALLGN